MNFRTRMRTAMLLLMLLCSLCVSSVLTEDQKEETQYHSREAVEITASEIY